MRKGSEIPQIVPIARLASCLTLLLVGPVLALVLPDVFAQPYGDSLYYSHETSDAGWLMLSHFSSNAVFSFRLDPLFAWIFGENRIGLFFAAETLIFGVGAFLFCLAVDESRRPFLCAFSASIASLCLVLLFGYDTLVFGSLVWLPWLLYMLHLILVQGAATPANFVFLAFFMLRLAKASNQLSLLLAMVSLLLVYFLAKDPKRKHLLIGFCIFAVLGLVEILRIPPAPLPLYPPFSRVVDPRVPLLEGADAYLGPIPHFDTTPIQIVDRAFLRSFLEPVCFTLLLLAVLTAVDVWKRRREGGRAFCWAAIIAAGICIAETHFVSPALSQIAPLYTLPRLFPGLVYLPVVFPAIAIAVFLLAVALVAARGYDLLAIILVLMVFPLQWANWRVSPYVERPGGAEAWEELQKEDVPGETREFRRKALLSPSYWLIREKGPHFFDRFPIVDRNINLVPLSRFEFELRSSHDQEGLERLVKRKQGVRWTSGGGRQNGDEWVHVQFKEPLAVTGVKLDVGGFPTDYPRGLEIYYSLDCPSRFDEYERAFSRKKWEGEVAYTAAGYPFLEPEANVLAVFDRPRMLRCLLIRQANTSEHFEWSITGLRIGQ